MNQSEDIITIELTPLQFDKLKEMIYYPDCGHIEFGWASKELIDLREVITQIENDLNVEDNERVLEHIERAYNYD